MSRMSTPTSAAWQMGDRLAQGQLAQRLLDLRGQGESWPDIARTLYADHGIVAHVSTLADWHRQLVDTDAEATA